MLVEKTDRQPHDMTTVGLNEDWEVRYWCQRFGTTETQLRECVVAVGPRVEDVERRLHEAGKKAFKNTGED